MLANSGDIMPPCGIPFFLYSLFSSFKYLHPRIRQSSSFLAFSIDMYLLFEFMKISDFNISSSRNSQEVGIGVLGNSH